MTASVSTTVSLCPGKDFTPLNLTLKICEIWIIAPFLNSCFEFCGCVTYYIIIHFSFVMLFVRTWNY